MNCKRLNELFVQIRKRRGRLTPATVVAEASNPQHPLHKEFDWDDASAARKHRLEHAARLIRLVKVKVVTPDGPVHVRQWHAVKAAGVIDAPEGYVPNEDIVSKPMYRQAMLRQMERDWKALVAKYDHLKEFWTMIRKSRGPKRGKRAG